MADRALLRIRDSNGPRVRAATRFQIIREGASLRIPPGARIGLLCSNDHWVLVFGPADWRLTLRECASGSGLLPGTYGRNLPIGGRAYTIKGALVLESAPRGPEEVLYAELLSPRNTAVRERRPPLLWARYQRVEDYEIERLAPASRILRLKAEEVSCQPGTGAWEGNEVCSIPYPADWPDLERGEEVFLSFGARPASGMEMQRTAIPYRVRLLTAREEEAVKKELELLDELPVDEATRWLWRGNAFAEQDLLGAAAAAHRQSLGVQQDTAVQVTLGDTYLAMGLLRIAEVMFRDALLSSDPITRASGEFGLGKIEYERQCFDFALSYFESARARYSECQCSEARAATDLAIQAVSLQSKRGGPRGKICVSNTLNGQGQ